ncbi:family 43 glycosylhydrolase [Pseudarthrobacter sp. DSP2-3-2b1]|uniref:glycoside hydrolase family 43 protein n=1 Tax=Pseudarthrobacter sp. DSP2-3-2b1 TaxID=2804661 RepID=UPI003CF781D9
MPTLPKPGMYRNPILNTDWPDLDAVRVGDDYYMVASSINRVPGLPILHSRDLVSWSIVGHAALKIEPAGHYSLPRHGAGVWAPAIRHHQGTFYLFAPDPDYGISVITAKDSAGPWSAPHLLLSGLGVIDPCPLWDDDGRAWMVFGWAKSRSGISNRLSVVEISPDAGQLLGSPVTVIDGDAVPGCSTLEGPKFYKRDGWYWIFAPAGGVTKGWQMVFRSRSVHGPYEGRTVLQTGSTSVNGPHQGAWVDTPGGQDWFLHFQDRGVFGRVTHLQPLRWDTDGWPVIGVDGEPVSEHSLPLPDVIPNHDGTPRNEDWSGTVPGLQWHWQANPQENWLALEGSGHARVRAVSNDLGSLRGVPQVLGQQLPGTPCTFSTTLRLVDVAKGNAVQQGRAGVVVLGRTYAWLGLVWGPNAQIVLRGGTFSGEGDESVADLANLDPADEISLRIRTDIRGVCQLEYRLDGGDWIGGVSDFHASAGQWISAELGLFACSAPGAEGNAYGLFGPVVVDSDA